MKTFNPKVSIIIPVYNGSNYLKEAIDSALAQTYKNIEIIVINDGSNDKGATEKIAKSYGNKIRYFKKKNGGVATALNLGIKKMTGEYFSWLSHDDMYYPDKIEKQINFLSNLGNKNVVLYSDYALLKGDRIRPVINHHEMLVRKKKYSLLRGAVNGLTLLIPKAIIDEVGYFKKELRCTQDYDYWMRIQKKFDFVHMQEAITVTRLHGDQDSNVSPVVVSEGDALWIRMIDGISTREKIMYEGTLYNFYFEMVKFLKGTPYIGAMSYCSEKLAELDKKNIEVNKYKVSVIIPFFNRVNKVLNALKSVEKQTHKNIEVILINDASTVNIQSIINYAAKHKNVRILNLEKNSGPAHARNIGIEAATGDYITFLDSDDEFLKDKLEKQLEKMLKHNPGISYTSYIKRNSDGDTIKGGYGMSGVVVPKIISSCPIATPTVMIKRSILLSSNNFRFNETMRIGEDTCFWLELAKSHEILLINEPLTIVNTNETSSAYDTDKLVVGMRNILGYLFSDSYYKEFYHELSLLCKDYYDLNNKIQMEKRKKLRIGKYGSRKIRQAISEKLENTLFYRAIRKLRRAGLSGLIKSILKKIQAE